MPHQDNNMLFNSYPGSSGANLTITDMRGRFEPLRLYEPGKSEVPDDPPHPDGYWAAGERGIVVRKGVDGIVVGMGMGG